MTQLVSRQVVLDSLQDSMVSAVTQYDMRESKKKSYNRYALRPVLHGHRPRSGNAEREAGNAHTLRDHRELQRSPVRCDLRRLAFAPMTDSEAGTEMHALSAAAFMAGFSSAGRLYPDAVPSRASDAGPEPTPERSAADRYGELADDAVEHAIEAAKARVGSFESKAELRRREIDAAIALLQDARELLPPSERA